MSFNRAAIKRFNEETVCSPSPTRYYPKLPRGYSAKNINFDQYSGRSGPNLIRKEGNNLQSCSDSRNKKGSLSTSSKSCDDIPPLAATVAAAEDTRLDEVQVELQVKKDLCATPEIELQMAKDEVIEKEDLAKSLAEQPEDSKKAVPNQQIETEEGVVYETLLDCTFFSS